MKGSNKAKSQKSEIFFGPLNVHINQTLFPPCKMGTSDTHVKKKYSTGIFFFFLNNIQIVIHSILAPPACFNLMSVSRLQVKYHLEFVAGGGGSELRCRLKS